MLNDQQLLARYAAEGSDAAFAELVARYINLVYSTALRRTNGDAHLAQDVVQRVFTDLARKARSLPKNVVLAGWLHRATRYAAAQWLRDEGRRQAREQEAAAMSALETESRPDWDQIRPLLDEALDELNPTDRDAVLLRFFEQRSLMEVGHAIGSNEDAARKRVSRALEKLHAGLLRRGVTTASAALSIAISGNAIQAAPAGLAATVASSAVAAAQTAVAAASSLTLIKGALQIMSSAKISVAIGLGAAAIIAVQWHQVFTQKQTLKQLEAQVALQTESNRVQQAEIATLQERNAAYVKTMEGMSRDVAKSRANARAARDAKQLAAEASKAAASAKGSPFADMFNDPETLKAMRPQQMATMKMMYGPLVKHLDLSPEQADKFYEILIDYGLKSVQATGSVKPGRVDPEPMMADLKSLLGDAGFAQYTDYTKNDMPGQTMLAAMKGDFADNPLSDTQQQQLLQAMKTARQSVVAKTPDLSKGNPSDSTAALGQALQQQEQINQKVLQQAASFLSPDQLHILGAFQTNVIQQQKAMAPIMQKMLPNTP